MLSSELLKKFPNWTFSAETCGTEHYVVYSKYLNFVLFILDDIKKIDDIIYKGIIWTMKQ
jgi:hypothetical protein